MDQSDNLSDNETLCQFIRNTSDTSNVTPKPSDERDNDDTVPTGEKDDFLGGHKTSIKPRWLQTGGGKGLWLWEILGIALSLCCIIAIVTILLRLDQTSLAKWRFPLAPNTTISTLITIAKTSMLLAVSAGISQSKWVHFTSTKHQIVDFDIFDQASRGPWGAFNFILRMKGRSAVTSVGAFAVVVSLAMEPFAQQILSFETRSIVSQSGSAHVSIAHSYDDSVSVLPSIGDSYIGPEFRAAFMMGILGSPIQWSFQCSTGNCSWPEFSTSGICASCANVTSSSQKREVITRAVNVSNGEWGTGQRSVYYTTPRGLELQVDLGGTILWSNTSGHPDPESRGDFPPSSLVTSTAVELDGKDRLPSDPIIAVAAISLALESGVMGQEDSAFDANRYRFPVPDITECIIRWCRKRYKGLEALNGAIMPTSVETAKFQFPNLPEGKLCVDGNVYLDFPNRSKAAGEETTNFTVSCNNYEAISKFLAGSLNFSVGNLRHSLLERYKNGTSAYISPMLISRPNVTELFENITESLTQHIQIGPNSTSHNGNVRLLEIHIKVRWPWVILPALVVIIGMIFLAAIIFVNHRCDLSLWKASLNPLLFHGLDGWELDGVDADTVSGMERLAKEMKTQLASNKDGRLKLVRG